MSPTDQGREGPFGLKGQEGPEKLRAGRPRCGPCGRNLLQYHLQHAPGWKPRFLVRRTNRADQELRVLLVQGLAFGASEVEISHYITSDMRAF